MSTKPFRLVSLLCWLLIFAISTCSASTIQLALRISNETDAARTFADECLSDEDCSPTKFCNDSFAGFPDPQCENGYCNTVPRRCLPRVSEGVSCRISSNDCAQGLLCRFKVSGPLTSMSVCSEKVPQDGACRLDEINPCTDDLMCSKVTQKCVPATTGYDGDPCDYDRDCKQHAGFYCKLGKDSGTGKCTKKKAQGARCDLVSDNYECAGFCLTVRHDRKVERGGRCTDTLPHGAACTHHSQCKRSLLVRDAQFEDAVCNVIYPGVSTGGGTCVLKSRLLRNVGDKCDPAADRCDARRNLRCAAHDGGHVCEQRSGLGGRCIPGSALSICEVKAASSQVECRRRFSLLTKTPYGADVCVRKQQTVPWGAICSLAEHALCEKGTSCIKAPGVIGRSGRYPPPPLGYCMKTVPLNGSCTDIFRTTCEKGLYCSKGKCTKGKKPQNNVTTLTSGVGISCAARKCAKGLICKDQFGMKSCQLPMILRAAWKPCSDEPYSKIKCTSGSHCTRGLKWDGIKRCRPPGGVDAVCDGDKGCKKGLKCGPFDRSDIFQERRCYDPAKAIKVGGVCNPKKSMCAIGNQAYELTKCLAKGGKFACQVESYLFEFCSKKYNIACAKGLVCTNSVCFQKKRK